MTISWNWYEGLTAVITLVTVGAFVFMGGKLRALVSRTPQGHSRNQNIVQRILKRTRQAQIKSFQRLASDIVCDANLVLKRDRAIMEARALSPLVADARKKGEYLLASQQIYHTYFFKEERKLRSIVEQLASLERCLKALPRSSLTLDDVLAGRFSQDPFVEQGV